MGVGRGPERLLEAGAGFELIRLVASRVREAIADGAYPVLLSGSCFAGVGVVTGLDEDSPGVVWFDAHGDFNTPESTIDGYFDGMGLAILTGSGWGSMVRTESGLRTVPETAAVLARARDFDRLEHLRLDSSDVRHLPTEQIDADDAVARAVEEMDPAPTGLYVHVDLDVLDSDEAKVNIYSVPGGLTARQLEAQFGSLLDTGTVRGVSLERVRPGGRCR